MPPARRQPDVAPFVTLHSPFASPDTKQLAIKAPRPTHDCATPTAPSSCRSSAGQKSGRLFFAPCNDAGQLQLDEEKQHSVECHLGFKTPVKPKLQLQIEQEQSGDLSSADCTEPCTPRCAACFLLAT